MSKQLIIVSGAPYSGRTTWINKNYCSKEHTIVDANMYPNLFVKSEKMNMPKIFEDTIEDSRIWCLEQVQALMKTEELTEEKNKLIILSLISSRPDRWREFIQLAISNEYEVIFKFPTNKLLFYSTRHNTSTEQSKFIESKVIHKYQKNKKEVYRKNAKGENELVMIETNESTLLKQIILELESAYAFYLQNKSYFTDKEELLKKINEHYKSVIIREIKKSEKKAKDIEKEAEKLAKQQEKQEKQEQQEKQEKQEKQEE